MATEVGLARLRNNACGTDAAGWDVAASLLKTSRPGRASNSATHEIVNAKKQGAYDDHGDEGAVDILIIRGRPEKELRKHQKHAAGYQGRSHDRRQIRDRHPVLLLDFHADICQLHITYVTSD